ncbi:MULTISPECIES: NAD(P)/FAD-dependent oxidoreductase [Cupriavidus]|uniref:HI0933-like protein n=1 Tax=Cupriavidus pinatubonensis (strain JMP 134 / LMG 1197) TaxID=264198 RepID=Q474B9_CUPPJ|nr:MULTISPECIES: NAD(P)/FAD-dependent oxidoreductase [Cupriavidus]QYY32459.1 NAD(P)/FAD-dependent oxidoreductase [Cupriavidus pinatubonensis]TPQ32222.1 NAD(P)/FAD-dependent oxidoreductase [Cupriavidus pinatubonensis]
MSGVAGRQAGRYDVAVLGAGAAGMMCAAVAGQGGARVVLIDHATKLAEKIRISGGGRCNFTNLQAGPANYLSSNPHFCRSALARYTPQHFLELMRRHRIDWHEKHRGQLFCNDSAEDVIAMLRAECDAGHVHWQTGCSIEEVRREGDDYLLLTSQGTVRARALVVATGGLSIPKIGATDFGYRIARQFGLKIIETRPALVPLTFDGQAWQPFVPLAGVSLEVDISTGAGKTAGAFREDLLWTHRGLSGPAVLQISSFWRPGTPIKIDLFDGEDAAGWLLEQKAGSRKHLANLLSQRLPARLADAWCAAAGVDGSLPLHDIADKALRRLGASLNDWQVVPSGTEGYRKAEVTIGGVDTRGLSSTTMMAREVEGLYFIGEVVDVTGWLGGYNFQWAWASAVAAGHALAEAARNGRAVA